MTDVTEGIINKTKTKSLFDWWFVKDDQEFIGLFFKLNVMMEERNDGLGEKVIVKTFSGTPKWLQ